MTESIKPILGSGEEERGKKGGNGNENNHKNAPRQARQNNAKPIIDLKELGGVPSVIEMAREAKKIADVRDKLNKTEGRPKNNNSKKGPKGNASKVPKTTTSKAPGANRRKTPPVDPEVEAQKFQVTVERKLKGIWPRKGTEEEQAEAFTNNIEYIQDMKDLKRIKEEEEKAWQIREGEKARQEALRIKEETEKAWQIRGEEEAPKIEALREDHNMTPAEVAEHIAESEKKRPLFKRLLNYLKPARIGEATRWSDVREEWKADYEKSQRNPNREDYDKQYDTQNDYNN